MRAYDPGDERGGGLRLLRARLVGLAAGVAIAGLFVVAGVSQAARLAQYERGKALLEASAVRMAIEADLNARINLERGLVAFAASSKALDDEGFKAYTEALRMGDDSIMNFAILEGTTLRYVHPYEPNKGALGRDLSTIPAQAPDVERAKHTRNPVISGPHELVQGGTGLISRMGVFKEGPEGPAYWGQASVVIDIYDLLRRSGMVDHPSLAISLERRAAPGDTPIFILKDERSLGPEAIRLDICLPGVTWTLSAAPREGWQGFRWLAVALSGLGLALGGFAGFAAHGLLSTRVALKDLAFHDQLTTLPNRMLFWDRLRMEARRADRDGTKVCVFMVDLDDFKAVNDDHGHAAGDRLLAEAAARMAAAVRRSDTVARLGGDEFAVIAPVEADAGIDEVAERLRACFERPFELGSVSRISSASIGLALYPDEGVDVEALLAAADHRMYEEKRSRHPGSR